MRKTLYPYLFRCPCCGIWCWTWHINKGLLIYCDACDYGERHTFRKGRNSCETCQAVAREFGKALVNHWDDPKPAQLNMTVTYDG